jgi:hypothetical protein
VEPGEELVVIRTVALLFALAVAQPALAQTAPTPAPNPSPTKPSPAKPSPAKPAAKKPAPPKSDASATPAAAAAAAAQHGPCIGVIPHVGDLFAVQNFGLFSYEFKEVPIESWGLDDLVVARVRAAAGTGMAVRRIAYTANAFEPYDKPPMRLFGDPENDLKNVVQTISRAGGCERYIAVVKAVNKFGNLGVKGIGIIKYVSSTYLFAVTTLFVFDGHTFDILKKVAPTGQRIVPDPFVNDLLRTSPIRGPIRELKDFSWPPAPDTDLGLRDATRALLAQSLDKALPELLAIEQ